MPGPTYNEQLQMVVRQYQEAGQPWPATTRRIAEWGYQQKLLVPYQSAIIRQFAEDLARALREEYYVDPQGRSVRAKHAARVTEEGEQLTLWADIRTAEPQHMEIAFQQRRQQIVGDCRQLKVDVDSFNDNANPDKPIQMVFDFTQDLAELEAMAALGVSGLLHRASAAFLAISRRRSGVRLAARAGPPLAPPRRPSAAAWGFFSGRLGFWRSASSPVASSTMLAASRLRSRGRFGLLERSGIATLCHGEAPGVKAGGSYDALLVSPSSPCRCLR